MALSATIFKAELQVSDLDRHYYAGHSLTLARHPSETDARMMVRLAVFALHADPDLAFTRGLSSEDEPDLWQQEPNGEIALWIELGQPDEKRIRRACGRARRVCIYSYQRRAGEVWWQQQAERLQRFDNLSVFGLDETAVAALGEIAERNMDLQATVQDGELWLSAGERSVQLTPDVWKRATD